MSARPASRAALALTAALGGLPLITAGLAAQAPGGRCIVDIEGQRQGDTRTNLTQLPSGKYDAFIGGGFVGRCRGQNVSLRSDSAEYYGDRAVWYLIGSVHYVEPRATVDSRRATYFVGEERLLAEGDVVAKLPNGSTMHGPTAEYYRAVPGMRPRARLVAVGRPRIDLVQTDSAGHAAEPVHVVADRVTMEGDSLVYAAGAVEITRPDIFARGDSAFLDSGTEFGRLMRAPSIEGRSTRPFRLSGERIDLFSKQRLVQRVLAAVAAHARSQDLDLTADTIDLRITANRLSRAYAWGRSRARAISPTQDLTADSLDVIMPGQQVEQVRALRRAVAEGVPDTAKFRSTERDWLRGDTIVARFDPPPVGDTTKQPVIHELVASGAAKSLYQIAPQSGRTKPSLNYVRGRQITVAFARGQVSTVTVHDQASGVYLEPLSDSTTAAQGQAAVPARTTPGGARQPTPPTAAERRP